MSNSHVNAQLILMTVVYTILLLLYTGVQNMRFVGDVLGTMYIYICTSDLYTTI